MWTKLILRGVGALAFAFVLTSAAMFWLPVFGRVTGWYDFGSSFYHYIGTGYDLGSYATSIDYVSAPDNNVKNLKKLSPVDERVLLDQISTELYKKNNSELFKIRAFPDVCINELVDCQGLASIKVKPFIDAVLSDRQTAETAFYSRSTNLISAGSLFVSFVALIFTGLSYRKKRATKTVS